MIDVCKEEGVSPEQVFFILLFFVIFFIAMSYPDVIFLCAKENSLEKFYGLPIKEKRKKNNAEFF